MENISNQYQRQTMKNWILILVLSVMTVGYVNAQKSTLQKQGTATQLVVDGKPFLILGGELGNSSAACTEDIERIFPEAATDRTEYSTRSRILGFDRTAGRTIRLHPHR